MSEIVKTETGKEKKYTPIGILNLVDVVPVEAWIVFSDKDNHLYFGYIDDNADLENKFSYDRFVSLPENEVRKNIKYFKELKCNKEEVKDSYSVGDIITVAFQIDENTVYVGRIDKYVEFLNQFKNNLTEDKYDKLLLDEINDSLNFYDLSKIKFEGKNKTKKHKK